MISLGLQRSNTMGTVKFRDDCFIVNNGNDYKIHIDRCNTHEKLLEWIWHLCEKTWMNNELMRQFIEVVCDHTDLNMDHGA